jgi:predicted ATPase
MPISNEMRKLEKKWTGSQGWPKRLEWLEIHGLRGWTGQRVDFPFPFTAIVGENGVGKSTILQAVASVYKSPTEIAYPSDFFPATPWEELRNAAIKASVREGDTSHPISMRKLTERWRGHADRRTRDVHYIDLRRLAPLSAQIGYSRIAKPTVHETEHTPFEEVTVQRLSSIIGRQYKSAGFSKSNADENRLVPVVNADECKYSGFHQGAGESTLVDFLQRDIKNYSILIVDEIETSLHPRSQRRLIRDLAEMCRVREVQIVVTTHSPYILEEIPPQGRLYIMKSGATRTLLPGVSPNFAMTQMDDEKHPDCEIYVEDGCSKVMLEEILAAHGTDSLQRRCAIIPCGAASVGRALGQMAANNRFPRPTVVVLDADQEPSMGCVLLPGDDAPERVVYAGLKSKSWPKVADKIERSHANFVDAAEGAMTVQDCHDWNRIVGDKITVGGDTLWRAMCTVWARECLDSKTAKPVVSAVDGALSL